MFICIILGNKYVLNKDEMRRFQVLEAENTTLTNRLKSMTKSVDLHMELLRRSELEVTSLKSKLEDAQQNYVKLNKDYEKFQKDKGIDAVSLANLRKDIIALRRENKDLYEQLKNVSHHHIEQQEFMEIKQGKNDKY